MPRFAIEIHHHLLHVVRHDRAEKSIEAGQRGEGLGAEVSDVRLGAIRPGKATPVSRNHEFGSTGEKSANSWAASGTWAIGT
jgi:hypothetical protein